MQAHPGRSQTCHSLSLKLELLNEASPTGAVEAGTVERLERRWTERCQQESAAVAKAESEVLAKYAADRAAQKCVPLPSAVGPTHHCAFRAADEANKLRGGALGDTVAGLSQLEKRRLMAQLDAGASSSDEDAHDGEDVDEERGKAEVQRAREEVRQRVEQRREAITKAVEREDRRKAEHELRRAVREQAGHTSGRGNKDKDGGTPSNGKGKGRGTH